MPDLFLRPLFTWRSAVASELGPRSPVTRHVLLTLALHMNEKGESCFPSIDTLTTESNLSRRSVVEHLGVAEKDGWLGKRAIRLSNGQGWRRVEYFAVMPPAIEATFHDKQRSAPDAPSKRGALNAPALEGGAFDDKGSAPDSIKVVQQVHPSTSYNSSKNSSYSDEFDTAWQTLPKRAGNDPKSAAFKAWNARINQRVTVDAMQAGAKRYAAFIAGTGKDGTEHVLMGATFFGPDRPFEQEWALPAPPKRKEVDPWWVDEKGIDRKGKELGLKPQHTENYDQYKARINAEIRKREGVTA